MSGLGANSGVVSITTQGAYNIVKPTYSDGDATIIQTDVNGNTIVTGGVAHDAADSGDPLKIGGKAVNAAPAAVTNNDRVNAYFDLNGRLAVFMDSATYSFSTGATDSKTLRVKLSNEDVAYLDGLEGFIDGVEALIGTTNTTLATLDGHVDQLEGFTDGIEALIGSTNTALATLDGHVDQLEGFTDGIEALIGTTNTTLATVSTTLTALDGHVDQLEGYTDGIEALLTTISTATKVEDAGHTTGDVGQFILGVRQDTVAALTNTDGDYSPIAVDQYGRVKTVPQFLSVVDQIDTSPGPVWDTASTTINGNAGAFVTAVAVLAAATKKIRVADTTGLFIGVYIGAAASEVLAFIINPGQSNEIEHSIAAGVRVSVRAMGATAITTGELCMQFLG